MAPKRPTTRSTPSNTRKKTGTAKPGAARATRDPLAGLKGRDLRLDLPRLGPANPGMAWIDRAPTTHETYSGPLTVLGTNTAGVWFAMAPDGSVHWVDDVERDLASGVKLFESVDAFAKELARQNP